METVKMILEYWVYFFILLIIGALTVYAVLRFLKLTPGKQIEKVKAALLYMVTEAEREFKSKTGRIKRSMVWEWLVERFPIVTLFLTEEQYDELLNKALEEFRKMLENNKELYNYVYGTDAITKEEEKTTESTVTGRNCMKILLISGHGDGDPGASSKFGVEATETVVMVQKIKETLGNYAQVDLYPTNRNAFKDLGKGCCQVNFGDYDYVLEVHFNSCVNDLAGDGKTTGTEIYVTTAEKTVGVEMKIVEKIAALGLKNRGVKRTNWRVIARAKASGTSSALLEVCFIDDKDDMQIYTAKKDQIAAAVATAIAEQFGLKKSGNSGNQGSKGITVGSTVTIKDGAVYGGLSSARGKTVPAAQRGGKKHTVDKIQVNNGVQEARLKDITSWVAVSSLQAV